MLIQELFVNMKRVKLLWKTHKQLTSIISGVCIPDIPHTLCESGTVTIYTLKRPHNTTTPKNNISKLQNEPLGGTKIVQ